MLLEEFPTEVLRTICDFSQRRDLKALSLANHHFRHVTADSLFRCIRLEVKWAGTNIRKLSFDIHESLQALHALSSVRQIVLVNSEREAPDFYLDECGDRPLQAWHLSRRLIEDESDDHPRWRPLVKLMQALKGLKECSWGCTDQIPSDVLDLVHRRQLKLHVQAFRPIRIMDHDRSTTMPLPLHPFERRLACSSSLRSIRVRICDLPHHNLCELQVLLSMVRGAAPGLEQLSMLVQRTAQHHHMDSSAYNVTTNGIQNRGRFFDRFIGSEPPDPVFLPPGVSRKSHLTHLEIQSEVFHGTELHFMHSLDLTNLTTLRLGPINTQELGYLSQCQWPNVIDLQLNFREPISELDASRTPLFRDNARGLFDAVGALRSLKLAGQFSYETVASALSRHSATLQELLLAPDRLPSSEDLCEQNLGLYSTKLIDLIGEECPNLEKLAFPVIRSEGNAREVQTYQKLGHIKSLKSIHLTIHLSPLIFYQSGPPGKHETNPNVESYFTAIRHAKLFSPLEDEDEDEEEHEYEKEYRLRHRDENYHLPHIILINRALDKALAESILRTIAFAKDFKTTSLRSLELRMHDKAEMLWRASTSPDLHPVMDLIYRPWACEIVPDHESESGYRYIVRECPDLGRYTNPWNARDLPAYISLPPGDDLHLSRDAEEYVQAVWPRCSSRNFVKNWHSFPLALTESHEVGNPLPS